MTRSYRLLWMMVLCITLGYMPWYNFSAVSKEVCSDLGLTARDVGLVLAVFQAGYVLLVPVVGCLVDRYGAKRVLVSATAASGFCSTILALRAHGLVDLLFLRLLAGVSAGAIYVPGMVVLAERYGRGRRGMVFGVYTAGLVAAYAGGYLVAGVLSSVYGWRWGVLWTSLPALLAAVLIVVFVPAYTDRGPNGSDRRDVRSHDAVMDQFWRVGLVVLGYMGHMWEQYAFWGWIGPFVSSLAQGWRMGPKEGALVSAMIVLGGVPACFAWGVVADRVGHSMAIVIAGLCSVTGEIMLGLASNFSALAAIVVAFWVGFWVVADSALYKVVLVEIVDARMRGLSLGVQSALGYLVTIPAPLVFGALLQVYNGPVDPVSARIWWPSFTVLGVGGLLAPLAFLWLRGGLARTGGIRRD